jgi:serine-type D-Ala-D-Ala carboxypeptidase/endopeptidase (penicillin-binding protein 4)
MRSPRRVAPALAALLAAVLTVAIATPVGARGVARAGTLPRWVGRIDQVVGDLPVGVEIAFGGKVIYQHLAWVRRPPASNEKLLLSMALLDRLDPATTIPTRVLATSAPVHGVIHGDLWIVGHGDPETGPSQMKAIAQGLAARGLTKIYGHVYGATGPFGRDWFAPGWKDYFPRYYIALPTALTYRGNLGPRGLHVNDPERLAAAALTDRLKALGVGVTKRPGLGSVPGHVHGLFTVPSRPLRSILHRMDLWSKNFYAEVLGKYLGARVRGAPGTIAKGAAAIEAFASTHGTSDVVAHDGSGLSYANRVSPQDIVTLLQVARSRPWGATLRGLLAHGGQGTLEDRLADVRLRAKTGTLDRISALSGWVWLERQHGWAEFSIMSSGITKQASMHVENAIVRVVSANAGPRT